MSKYNKSSLLIFLILIFTCLSSIAQGKNICVLINGEPIVFSGVQPIEYHGHVFVPIRGVLEKLGAVVTWVPSRSVVHITRGTESIDLPIGKKQIIVHGKPVQLEVPARMFHNQVMVPLRFVSEWAGAVVRWDPKKSIVSIETTPIASAPAASESHGLTITSLIHNANRTLVIGDTLEIQMTGTPDSTAVYQIPGLTGVLPMLEDPYESGLYKAAYTVPNGIRVINGNIYGRLIRGNASTPLAQAPAPFSIDSQAPQITSVLPSPNQIVSNSRPNILVEYDDSGGSGIDISKVKLFLNEYDITRYAKVTNRWAAYLPPLPLSGTIHMKIQLSDRAGNSTVREWYFTPTENIGGIRSLTHNGFLPLKSGSVLSVVMRAVPNRQAFFQISGVTDPIPMQEVSLGKYVGSYTVKPGDQGYHASVDARLILSPDNEIRSSATAPVSIVPDSLPVPPAIENLHPGDIVVNPFNLTGHALPGSIVHVKVLYQNQMAGIYRLAGVAADQEVITDTSGRFNIVSLPLAIPAGAGDLQYVVWITSRDLLGRESEPVQIPLKQ